MLRPADASPRIATPCCSSPADPAIAGASSEMVHAAIPLDDPPVTSCRHNALHPLVTIFGSPMQREHDKLKYCLCIAYAPLFCTTKNGLQHDESKFQSKKQ